MIIPNIYIFASVFQQVPVQPIGQEKELFMDNRPILKKRTFLYLTEFFSGVAVMAVELGASRLLAPYFSSSQIVWTIIIGTIMIAMALGNIYGGREADKHPNPDRLYRRILIAAIWIALIPVVGKYVILAVSALLIFTVSTNFLIAAAFAACMIIFVFPLFLLGTVTPSLVKYTTKSLEDNGRIVGNMEAFNTVGSILGTFLPTFVTIPAVGTSVTFLIFAGILLALALVYFLSGRTHLRTCAAAVAAVVLCAVFGHTDSFAFWESDLLYEGESVYNYLQVKETDRSVILSTNVLFGVQSVKQKGGGLTGMYYDTALAAPLMADIQKKPQFDILILGMGSGTYATQCGEFFPSSPGRNLSVEGVEIDRSITDLARTYFDLPEDVAVATYDGRAYLQAVDKQYDVILVDAYQDITIPFQMSTAEFFTLVRDHLKEDGVMAVNMNMHSDGAGSINAHLADTIASVFSHVYTADVPHTTNRELFAWNCSDVLETFSANTDTVESPELRRLMETVLEDRLVPYQAGDLLLTDDCAPVELLGIHVIDTLIQNEVAAYREVYEQEGVQGLMDRLL